MKKILSVTILLMSGMVHAQDVYVYQNNVYIPVLHAPGFRCVAFGTQDLEIRTTDGNRQTVPYEQCDYIRFTPTPVPVGITDAPSATDSARQVFSITGQPVGHDLSSLPAGIYLLHETHHGKENVKKILKK